MTVMNDGQAPSSPERRLSIYWHELASAALAVWRSPRYAVPALLTVALSLGGATAVFSVFSALVLRPLAFPREDELVELGVPGPDGSAEAPRVSAPLIAELQKADTPFESIAVNRYEAGLVAGPSGAKHALLQSTSLDFFDALGARAELGRVYTARGPAPDSENVVVVRHRYWLDELGARPLGETLIVNERPHVLIGIIPDDQAIPGWGEMWLPSRQRVSEGDRFAFWLQATGRLRSGVSVELARTRVHALIEALDLRDSSGALIPIQVTPIRERVVGERRGLVSLMLAAVVAFQLLACANLAALLATRASVRQREHAVRSALGASRWVLARQSAFEALILVSFGGGVGLVLASYLIAPWAHEYRDLLGNTPPRLDGRVLAGFAGLFALTAAVAALAPALHLRRTSPMDALRGEGRSSQSWRARRVRESLVALQVAVSLALLVNAGLLMRSVQALLAVDTGFDSDGLIYATVDLPTLRRGDAGVDFPMQYADATRKTRAIFDRLEALPGSRGMCLAGDVPFDHIQNTMLVEAEAGAQRTERRAELHWFSPGCFAALGIPLLSGRDFTLDEARAGSGAIVNRAFARQMFGADDALGRRFRVAAPGQPSDPSAPWIDIIGISGDVLESDLTRAAEPAFYAPYLANPMWRSGEGSVSFAVAIRAAGDPEAMLAALPRAIADVNVDAAVYDVDHARSWIAHTFRDRAAVQRLLMAFAVAAIGLAAIGLFGVTGYAVAERSSEIGIRRALGASRREILGMILRETAVILLIGGGAGLGLSWLGRGVLDTLLYDVSASDPLTIACVSLGTALIGLLAALPPALAAARVSPSRALADR